MTPGGGLGATQRKRAEESGLPPHEVDTISAACSVVAGCLQEALIRGISPKGMHMLFTNIEELLKTTRPLIPPVEAQS